LQLAAREKTGEMDPVRPGAKHGTWVDLPDVVVVLEALSQFLSLCAAWRHQGVMCDPLLVSEELIGDLVESCARRKAAERQK